MSPEVRVARDRRARLPQRDGLVVGDPVADSSRYSGAPLHPDSLSSRATASSPPKSWTSREHDGGERAREVRAGAGYGAVGGAEWDISGTRSAEGRRSFSACPGRFPPQMSKDAW